MNGILQHLLFTLRLNFRSKQALVYGYLVPIFFLLAFGSVFHSSVPPLLHEMGQLITITVLGGACFGMPTGMVSERERGVWRRYRLLPASSAGIVISAMVARYFIVLLAVLMQFGLAWCLYRTPFPARPAETAVAFTAVCFAFLGLGLIIAMLADAVPAVQALGQAIFLPMIMIGGVGVPLRTLPPWAQHVAAFLPGRYAVEALNACVEPGGPGLAGAKFALAALFVIGAAACVTGARLFRWDAGRHVAARVRLWILLALAAWAAVGLMAERRGRAVAAEPGKAAVILAGWQTVLPAGIDGIRYDDLAPDDGVVTPIVPNLENLPQGSKERALGIQEKLAAWEPGAVSDPVQRVRNLLSVAATADVLEDPDEGAIGYVILGYIRSTVPPEDLKKMLAWIALHPDDGTILAKFPELGIEGEVTEGAVRERSAMYARKLLMRLLGKKAG